MGLGDLIRFSPILKGLEEQVGKCKFDIFGCKIDPLKHIFDVSQISILPINYHKHYDLVLNFSKSLEYQPESDKDKEIWKGFIGHQTTGEPLEKEYLEFDEQFCNLESKEFLALCKKYNNILTESTTKRYSRYFGIKPSNFELLYKVTDEENQQSQQYLSKEKLNIAISARATKKIRSLTKEKLIQVYDLIKQHNIILLGKEEQYQDIDIKCKRCFEDFRTCGAVINNCDFIITVDSVFSHLSFALGKSVIVLYSYGQNFTKPVIEKGKIIKLEHETEDCNSIPIEDIRLAISQLTNILNF